MAWQEILGQDTVVNMLQRSIVNNRIPQALLLNGKPGFGTLAIAVAFARVTNCLQQVSSGSTIEACGECKACVQMRSLQHPNFSIVTALPSGKAENEDELPESVMHELREITSELAEDAYSEFQLANATLIKIGQIRALKKQLSLSSAQEGRRVVVVHRCEEMTQGAANALLKTLEEPHEGVTIILTTAHPERLLPTIVSRCQEVIVPPIADDVVASALVNEGRCTAQEAALVVPFAEGSLLAARAYLNEDLSNERLEAVDLLRSALKGTMYRTALTDAVAAVTGSRDKNRVLRALSLMSIWIRDASLIAHAGKNARVVNVDQVEALQRFVSGFPNANLSDVLRLFEHAERDIHRNVSPTLVLTTTLASVRTEVLKGRAA